MIFSGRAGGGGGAHPQLASSRAMIVNLFSVVRAGTPVCLTSGTSCALTNARSISVVSAVYRLGYLRLLMSGM
jgi:hypothetical protein